MPHVQTPNNAFINSNAGTFSEDVIVSAKLGGSSEENKGGFEEIDIANSSLGLNYIICTKGNYGGRPGILGEIMIYAGFATNRISSFTTCEGQFLSISSNQSLYSLVGISYGGNGITEFNLPLLKNRIPLCISKFEEVGQSSGANKIRLSKENLPEHSHNVKLAANQFGDGMKLDVNDGVLNRNAGLYSSKESENAFLGGIKENTFEGNEIDIRNPFLSVNYLICKD